MRQLPVKPNNHAGDANRVRKILGDKILDLVFPPRCAGCGTWNQSIFCRQCDRKLKRVATPICFCCGAPFDQSAQVLPDSLCSDCRDNRYHDAPVLDHRRALFEYSGPMRKAIHALKYQNKTALAIPLAAWLAEYSANSSSGLSLAEIEIIVPIPLHPVRQWRRGYNQSTLLAQELSKLTQIPVAPILKRVRHTIPQVELHANERSQNIKGAFAINENAWLEYSGAQNILLLDDVATTGATLDECARVLKKRGAAKVCALTLARID